ncbi:MAG: S9 family peptidase, partial [Acidobacteriota bacterium]
MPSRPAPSPGQRRRRPAPAWFVAVAALCAAALAPSAVADDHGLSIRQLNEMRTVRDVAVSPRGDLAAYVLEVPRRAGVDEDGSAYRELHVVSLEDGTSRGYVTGEVNVGNPAFTVDGELITYSSARFGGDPAVWAIPVAGGESRVLIEREGLSSYSLSPTGDKVALIIHPSVSDERQDLIDLGYDREVFEEEWRAQQLWIVDMPSFTEPAVDPDADDGAGGDAGDKQGEEGLHVPLEGTASGLEWSADGERLAVTVAPRNLVDDSLMFRRLRVIDADSGEVVRKVENPGKLGAFALSPDGSHLALVSGEDINDPREGRLMVAAVDGDGAGELRDLMPDYQAHVQSIAWRDGETLFWVAAEGSEATFGRVDIAGTVEKVARSNQEVKVPVMSGLSVTVDGTVVALGQSPSHPNEVFSLEPGGRPKRLTNSNPWLADVKLAKQEVISWTASDGLEIEGMLIHPLDGRKPAPLLLMVHGGPEANDANGWLSSYSRPGQVAAARGYAVLYPNYRGSTGRGVEFSELGQSDAAGAEFRDLVESVDHLAEVGVADKDRVGITGGSYGGYATAWGSTFYTDYFKAGVMFVGISNKSSKGFTTDIPQEDVLVHTRFDAWEKWEFGLERSPIYHAEKSKTPLLIAHGQSDTRVHPSQSLQLYRALKLMGKTVR